MKNLFRLLVLILVTILLVSCVPNGNITEINIAGKDVNTSFTKIGNSPNYGLFRVEDKEKDITCWLYIGVKNSSISCMPNHEMTP
jgi:hypothetical protein